MRLTISKKLIGAFLSIAALIALTSGFSYYYMTKIDTSYSDLVDRRAIISSYASDIRANASEEVSILRGYLISMDDEAIEQLNQSNVAIIQDVERAKQLVKTEAMQQAFENIRLTNSEFQKRAEEIISLAKSNREQAIEIANSQTIPFGLEMIQEAEKVVNYQETEMKAASMSNTAMVQSSLMLILSISIAALLLAIVIGLYMSRLISKPIVAMSEIAQRVAAGDLTTENIQVKSQDELHDLANALNEMLMNLRTVIEQVHYNTEQVAASAEELTANAEQTSAASEQISASIQEVAMGTERQAQSVEESLHTVREMSVGISEISSKVLHVSDYAKQAMEKASDGGKSISLTVQQMNAIHETIQGLATVVHGLGVRSREIGQIIEAITAIASQTNMLSLNAAIEAARAGEHGKGFAVVAEEVRKLAEQSASSAKQISHLIGTIQKETTTAVQAMEQGTREVQEGLTVVQIAGSSFSQIQQAVGDVADRIQEVSAASEQIAAGSQQVVSTIGFIAEISEEAAAGTREVSTATAEQMASMEEISTAASSLTHMAEDLQALVGKFKL